MTLSTRFKVVTTLLGRRSTSDNEYQYYDYSALSCLLFLRVHSFTLYRKYILLHLIITIIPKHRSYQKLHRTGKICVHQHDKSDSICSTRTIVVPSLVLLLVIVLIPFLRGGAIVAGVIAALWCWPPLLIVSRSPLVYIFYYQLAAKTGTMPYTYYQ